MMLSKKVSEASCNNILIIMLGTDTNDTRVMFYRVSPQEELVHSPLHFMKQINVIDKTFIQLFIAKVGPLQALHIVDWTSKH